jgi:Xaa-Pro aminopeptidase
VRETVPDIDITTSGPDFPPDEFAARLERAQRAMAAEEVDALLFTTEPEVRYFTGFRTLFWQSPTRPWFLVIPAKGGPIAVVPEIGAALMRGAWVSDVHTWSSPHPDDDGISLLADLLRDAKRIGMPMGRESSLRMPLADFLSLHDQLPDVALVDATSLVSGLRMVKSEREIALLRRICAIGSDAFEAAPRLFCEGMSLRDAFRAFRIALLEAGADDVPYLVGGAGPDGYADVISPPSDRLLARGDVLMLDTGASRDGYFCDFDRNYAFGTAGNAARRAYETLWQATEAGLAAARPGATCADIHAAMQQVIGQSTGDVGRYGHGLGMQLTEAPSIISFDRSVLEEGMVLTLEPSMVVTGDSIMVHEENVVIRDGTPELLTRRAPPELPVIG